MSRDLRRQHGFALLLTLVLLMIGGVALSHVARQSAGEALHALEAAEQLQRRWAVTSCRETLLPKVQGLLDKVRHIPVDEDGRPVGGRLSKPVTAELRVSCELAGLSYDLVLTDEQAKFNPAALGALKIADEPLFRANALRSSVIELAGLRDAGVEGQVVLRPMVGVDDRGEPVDEEEQGDEPLAVYGGYGQLLEGVSPEDLLGGLGKPGIASRLTCWGDGRIHLRRAPEQVVKRVLSPLLGADGVAQLLLARKEQPGKGPTDWLSGVIAATPEQRAIAGTLLVERSDAHGLWVIGHGQRRSWYTLAVRVRVPEDELEDTEKDVQPGRDAPAAEAQAVEPDPFRRYDYAW